MNRTRAHGTTACGRCGSGEILSVSMNMEDGAVSYWTCSACEATGWQRGGSEISRDSALARIPRR